MAGDAPTQSRSGAVLAATDYLVALGAMSTRGSAAARRTVDSITLGSLRAQLDKTLPAIAGRIASRLAASRSPSAFDGWPLAYRVRSFDHNDAIVDVWHLDTASASALRLAAVDYTTTSYRLRWLNGAWRIASVLSSPGPTPPSAGASPHRLDGFARAVSTFSRYQYVP